MLRRALITVGVLTAFQALAKTVRCAKVQRPGCFIRPQKLQESAKESNVHVCRTRRGFSMVVFYFFKDDAHWIKDSQKLPVLRNFR